MQDNEYEVSLGLSNTHGVPITLIIEPWGEVYEMVPNKKYTICFRSPFPPSSPHEIEVVYAPDSITVYAWDGCLFTLFSQGEIISPGGAFDAPRVPEGIEVLKSIGFFSWAVPQTIVDESPDNERDL